MWMVAPALRAARGKSRKSTQKQLQRELVIYMCMCIYIYIHNYLIISSYFIHRISGASETPALRDSPIGDQNAQRELNEHKNMPTMKENHNIWYVVTVLHTYYIVICYYLCTCYMYIYIYLFIHVVIIYIYMYVCLLYIYIFVCYIYILVIYIYVFIYAYTCTYVL